MYAKFFQTLEDNNIKYDNFKKILDHLGGPQHECKFSFDAIIAHDVVFKVSFHQIKKDILHETSTIIKILTNNNFLVELFSVESFVEFYKNISDIYVKLYHNYKNPTNLIP